MNMKEYEHIMNNRLGLDDTFTFKCRECGQCCHNRHDIMLTAYDIFRIAKHLNKTPADIITKHCEIYIGDNSRIPIVRAVPKIHDAVCPFLRKGKCSVHSSKPILCATFPLARIHTRDNEVFYYLQDVGCGEEGEPHTVREWLASFNIPEADAIGRLWSDTVISSSEYMLKRKNKREPELKPVWDAMTYLLYFSYDVNRDFLEQLMFNSKMLNGIFASKKRMQRMS